MLESEVKEFTIFANLMLNVQWILMNIILKYVHTFLFTRENFFGNFFMQWSEGRAIN